MLMFDTPQPRRDKANVLLPLRMDDGAYVQRLVKLVADVALHEDRWAVDVLSDMLRQPVESTLANAPTASTKAEPVHK
jgi:hypothetical protein